MNTPLVMETSYGPAASRTLAVTLRSAPLVPFGHASRRLSSGFARRRGRGANQPEVRGHKGWARLARLARQRDRKSVRTLAYSTPLRQLAHSPVSAIAQLARSKREAGGVGERPDRFSSFSVFAEADARPRAGHAQYDVPVRGLQHGDRRRARVALPVLLTLGADLLQSQFRLHNG